MATESTVGQPGRRGALKNDIPAITSFHTSFPAYVQGYGLGLLERPVWKHLRSFHEVAAVAFCLSSVTRTLLGDHGFQWRSARTGPRF